MRLGVVGSRSWPVLDIVRSYVRAALKPGDILVSGGARGVDVTAEREAKALGNYVCIFYPNWERGRGAGYARNVSIAHDVDQLQAFWVRGTRGTAHTVGVTQKLGKEVNVVEYIYGCTL